MTLSSTFLRLILPYILKNILFSLTVASTCRKEQVREYYTENDCRSRQPLKYAKCVGGCGNQCCAAKIVRRRKVRNSKYYIKQENLFAGNSSGESKNCKNVSNLEIIKIFN